MSQPADQVVVAPTADGCCLRVIGRGTLKQSPAARDVAVRLLESNPVARVTVDLTDCAYLDSTFLGMLLELHRKAVETPGTSGPRFRVVASPERHHHLLGPIRLDRVIPASDAAPEPRGSWVPLIADPLDRAALGQHVIECHRALAEVDGPMQETFARIVEVLEHEESRRTD